MKISKRDISVMFGYIDAVITVIFFYMIFSLKYSQKSALKNIYDIRYAPQLFAVNIENLPKMPKAKLKYELWTFFRDYIRKYMKGQNNNTPKIFDIILA